MLFRTTLQEVLNQSIADANRTSTMQFRHANAMNFAVAGASTMDAVYRAEVRRLSDLIVERMFRAVS